MITKTYLMQKVDNPSIVKIGKSYNVANRKKQLESQTGFNLAVVAVIDFDIESDIHDHFKKFRIEGEWFFDDGSITEFFTNQDKTDFFIQKNKVVYENARIQTSQIATELEICQHTGMINLSKVVSMYNLGRQKSQFNLSQWLKCASTLNLITECDMRYGVSVIVTRGRYGCTIAHQAIFMDMLMRMDVDFKIEMHDQLLDRAIRFAMHNDADDSYKRMAGALYVGSENKAMFPAYIQKVASQIRLACNVSDWQTATETQLKQRDRIHDAVTLLSDVLRNNDDAVRLAILKNM